MMFNRAMLPLNLISHTHQFVFDYPEPTMLNDEDVTLMMELYATQRHEMLKTNSISPNVWVAFYLDAVELRCHHGENITPTVDLVRRCFYDRAINKSASTPAMAYPKSQEKH